MKVKKIEFGSPKRKMYYIDVNITAQEAKELIEKIKQSVDLTTQ